MWPTNYLTDQPTDWKTWQVADFIGRPTISRVRTISVTKYRIRLYITYTLVFIRIVFLWMTAWDFGERTKKVPPNRSQQNGPWARVLLYRCASHCPIWYQDVIRNKYSICPHTNINHLCREAARTQIHINFKRQIMYINKSEVKI